MPKSTAIIINAAISVVLGALLLVISYSIKLKPEETSFWKDATHEVGFASIVAVLIWLLFDFFSKSETEEIWIKRIETMSKSVFLGVFGRNLPQDYVQEATNVVLSQNFVRSSIDLTYTLDDKTYQIEPDKNRGFVCLNATARIKMKNVSGASVTLPIQLGLPNPLVDEMKNVCKLNRATLKIDGIEKELDLSIGKLKFEEQLQDDKKYHAVYLIKEIIVPSDRIIELFYDYSMAKEEEDTEIFHTTMPAERLSITIVDSNFKNREIRARSIHRCDLKDNSPMVKNGTYSFTLDEFMLPHQGFAIWWKWIPQRAQKLNDLPIDETDSGPHVQ